MKTYKTISTVTAVLANGETVVYDNAGLYQSADGHLHVFSIASSKDMARMAPGEYRVVTRTIECREVKKRVVYIVQYVNGVETEHESLASALCSAHDDTGAYEHLHSIRREEREEFA